MILNVDKEGKILIVQMCDVIFRLSGVKNINLVNKIFGSMKVVEEVIPEVEDNKEE